MDKNLSAKSLTYHTYPSIPYNTVRYHLVSRPLPSRLLHPLLRVVSCHDASCHIQAQIEDGHGMAERVSRSVRRLDDIQMRVQRALALVEDVINLRECAEVCICSSSGGGCTPFS